MDFYAQAFQDEFAARVLGFKQGGYFLDIGSGDPIGFNNTHALESLKWVGLCIDILDIAEKYTHRRAKYLKLDATTTDYQALFERESVPASIDYLSLDVDECSTKTLQRLLLPSYRYKTITVEHDAYLHGDKFRAPQRKMLTDAGYLLIFADICPDPDRWHHQFAFFEDWWIDPTAVSFRPPNDFKGCRTESGGYYASEIMKLLRQ